MPESSVLEVVLRCFPDPRFHTSSHTIWELARSVSQTSDDSDIKDSTDQDLCRAVSPGLNSRASLDIKVRTSQSQVAVGYFP